MKNDIHSRPRIVERIVRSVEAQPTRNQFFLLGGVLLCLAALFLAVEHVSARFSTAVPTQGGIVREGLVGYPRIINPVYAEKDVERDMTALVYAGLLKQSSEGLVPDLAETVTESDDGMTYTATLREDAVFHDGTPITAEDVVFTVEEIQNPTNESPLLADWSGVSAEALDERTVRFTLGEPYTFFRQNLTLGIVPKHLWGDVSSESLPFLEIGSNPVGSGPFEVADSTRNDLGVVESYTLEPFEEHPGEEPYIDAIELNFFEDQDTLFDALHNGSIDTAPIFPLEAPTEVSQYSVSTAPMSRSFGLFWNQNNNELFVDRDVRRALSYAVDRETLVEDVFGGYAEPLAGPLPAHALEEAGLEPETPPYDPEEARSLLAENGWEENEDGVLENDETTLSFTITTGDIPELIETAEFLRSSFESIGADIEIETQEIGVLSRDHIRPRTYDALLFGLSYNHSLDLAPFFHSSNSADPGLNVAQYTNADVDDALETLRTSSDEEAQTEALEAALEGIREDQAALFLYAPEFTYMTTPNVRGIDLHPISEAHERFASIANWYVNTDRIYTIFNR